MTAKKNAPARKKIQAGKQIAKIELNRRDKFCHEFVLNGQNATQAYLSAGYKVKNENVAGVCAFRLLRDARVRSRIQELQTQYHELLTQTREQVIQEIDRLSKFDPIEFLDEKGGLLPLHQMSETARKAIQEMELVINEDGATMAKVKQSKDRRGYLDMMAKYYNIYEQHQNAGTGEINVVHYCEMDAYL